MNQTITYLDAGDRARLIQLAKANGINAMSPVIELAIAAFLASDPAPPVEIPPAEYVQSHVSSGTHRQLKIWAATHGLTVRQASTFAVKVFIERFTDKPIAQVLGEAMNASQDAA
jgi:hypothetical protein